MLSESYYKECEEVMNELYKEGEAGDMQSEAQAQCLESWLECSDDYTDEWFGDSVMDSLSWKTENWLRGQMDDCSEEELEEGGMYHWMVQAVS